MVVPPTPLPCDVLQRQPKGRPSHARASVGAALWIAGAGTAFAAERVLGSRTVRVLTLRSASHLIFVGFYNHLATKQVGRMLEEMGDSGDTEDLPFASRIGYHICQGVLMSLVLTAWDVSQTAVSLASPLLQGVIAYRATTAFLYRTRTL